jgi:hypothetical protein
MRYDFKHSLHLGMLVVLVAPCSESVLLAQTSVTAEKNATTRDPPPPPVDPSFDKSLLDPRAFVDSLVNRNPPPLHAGSRHSPTFDSKFDWVENERVANVIELAIKYPEQIWAELVSHLEDERYCITFKAFSGYTYDWTVGRVCREIVGRNLSEAYYETLRPMSQSIYSRMRQPEVGRDPQQLKAWCEARRDKKLYEMQIEMCRWAQKMLADETCPVRGTPLRRKAWIATIEAEIEEIQGSQSAVRFTGFGTEEFRRYYGPRLPREEK